MEESSSSRKLRRKASGRKKTTERAETWVCTVDYVPYAFSKSYMMTEIKTPSDTQDSEYKGM